MSAEAAQCTGLVREQGRRATLFNQDACFQHQHSVESRDVGEAMTDHQDRVRQAQQHLMHLFVVAHVDITGRLVAQENLPPRP